MIPKGSNLRIYRSLSEINIILFWKILTENAIHLLDIDYIEGKQYTAQELAEMQTVWIELYDAWYIASDNRQGEQLFNQDCEKLKLLLRIGNLEEVRKLYLYLQLIQSAISTESFAEKANQAYDLLKISSPKYRGNMFADIATILSDIDRMQKSAANMYNEKIQVVDKKAKKAVSSIFKSIAQIGTALGMQLNPHIMSVMEFLEYQKLALDGKEQ